MTLRHLTNPQRVARHVLSRIKPECAKRVDIYRLDKLLDSGKGLRDRQRTWPWFIERLVSLGVLRWSGQTIVINTDNDYAREFIRGEYVEGGVHFLRGADCQTWMWMLVELLENSEGIEQLAYLAQGLSVFETHVFKYVFTSEDFQRLADRTDRTTFELMRQMANVGMVYGAAELEGQERATRAAEMIAQPEKWPWDPQIEHYKGIFEESLDLELILNALNVMNEQGDLTFAGSDLLWYLTPFQR